MDKPSVILMGSKPGSVVALSTLLERRWTVAAVVIAEGFGHSWMPGPSLSAFAKSRGLQVVTQKNLPRDSKVDYIVSYMYRRRVKPEILALAKRAAINFHPAPLPKFAGWAFYNVAIWERSSFYGCTCHHMDEHFDTGPIVQVRHFPINHEKETAVLLEKRTQKEMIQLFIEVCKRAELPSALPCSEQKSLEMRYMTKAEFEKLKRIPDDADSELVDRTARAFWYPPYECAYFEFGGRRIEVVPQQAKLQAANLLHANDLIDLMTAARTCPPKTSPV